MPTPVRKNDNLPSVKQAVIILFLTFITVFAWAEVLAPPKKTPKPLQAKSKQNNAKKVYLEYADELEFDQQRNADYQVLRGNVKFRKDSMYMYCDSAYFYEKTNSFDAFSNVRMEQGDTLFVYADFLYYDGLTQFARLRENVRLENRDVILLTDSLDFDQRTDVGYYNYGGKILDLENELTSTYGEYATRTKKSAFRYEVKLTNPRYTLYSDTLLYNTQSKVADIVGPSVIVSDTNTIYSSRGWYNTQTDRSELFDRSRVVSKNTELIGDTIYYNRNTGLGEVFGNMWANDTTHKVILEGDYGYHNEKTEYSFATKRARVIEYSGVDSIFMHGDTLKSFNFPDRGRILKAYHGVRIFSRESQGVCDSLIYLMKDSLLKMTGSPILWNNSYQIFGDTINVYLNDSTIDRMYIPNDPFVAQQKDSIMYDQLSGKTLMAYFVNGEMRRVDVNGNVETIFYPQESDQTLIGLNHAESSFLTMYMRQRQMERLIMWPDVSGKLTPPQKIKQTQRYLRRFKWYGEVRPTDKEDIFRQIKREATDTNQHKRGRKARAK